MPFMFLLYIMSLQAVNVHYRVQFPENCEKHVLKHKKWQKNLVGKKKASNFALAFGQHPGKEMPERVPDRHKQMKVEKV